MEKLIKRETEDLPLNLAQWESRINLRMGPFVCVWSPFGVDSRESWRAERELFILLYLTVLYLSISQAVILSFQ